MHRTCQVAAAPSQTSLCCQHRLLLSASHTSPAANDSHKSSRQGHHAGASHGHGLRKYCFCQENLPFLCFINKTEKGIPRKEKTRKDTKNNTNIDVTSDLIFSTLLFLDLC